MNLMQSPRTSTLLCFGSLCLALSAGCNGNEANTPRGNGPGDSGTDTDAGNGRELDGGATRCASPLEAQQLVALEPEPDSFREILSAAPGTDPSGLIACADESIHRVRAEQCLHPLPVNRASHCDGFYPDFDVVCDSFEPDGGHCTGVECYEPYGCEQDTDCNDAEVCVCASGVRASDEDGFLSVQSLSICVPADCKTDADCGDQECGAIEHDCGGTIVGFACRTPEDECHGPGECAGGLCNYDESRGRWLCGEYSACE
jgi:hypothetical protein